MAIDWQKAESSFRGEGLLLTPPLVSKILLPCNPKSLGPGDEACLTGNTLQSDARDCGLVY